MTIKIIVYKCNKSLILIRYRNMLCSEELMFVPLEMSTYKHLILAKPYYISNVSLFALSGGQHWACGINVVNFVRLGIGTNFMIQF